MWLESQTGESETLTFTRTLVCKHTRYWNPQQLRTHTPILFILASVQICFSVVLPKMFSLWATKVPLKETQLLLSWYCITVLNLERHSEYIFSKYCGGLNSENGKVIKTHSFQIVTAKSIEVFSTTSACSLLSMHESSPPVLFLYHSVIFILLHL